MARPMSVFILLLQGLVAFVLSYTGVALIRRWALQRDWLDIPNERSLHSVPTPRGGGIVIAAILIIGVALGLFWEIDLEPRIWFGFLLGLLVVAGTGVVDDWFSISARTRLLVHLLVAVVFVVLCGDVGNIYLPFIGALNLGWLGVPIALFWIVGLTNAYNFMDGIDGIAAGQAIVGGGAWVVVCWTLGLPSLSVLSALLVGASLGFLPHNLPPARIFMGDVGSTTLGFAFAVLPILVYSETGNARVPVSAVLFVAPFVFDSALTLVRRAAYHENLFQPHRSHLYQRLVRSGHSQGAVSLLYTGLALITGLMGIAYLSANDSFGSLISLVVVAGLSALAVGVTWIERQRDCIDQDKQPASRPKE
ncbi:MAG: glycosyltransferase family 4 protein [Chloroflexi bacterium]|nr:glycosyltransferase family 4 protein [Chloroflexota bacterium]